MTKLERGGGSTSWSHDLHTDTAVLAGSHRGGLERFDDIDLAAGTAVRERYSIATTDPLSAEAALAWTIRRERPGWRIRIEASITIGSTADSFIVRQSLAAFENDASVFAQDVKDRIARDLV
jgi:hypothetical protein